VVAAWAKELETVILRLLCEPSLGVTRILSVVEGDQNLLNELYSRLVENAATCLVKNDRVFLLKPECGNHAIIYYIDSRHHGSQGFAGVLRDSVGPRGISLILLGSPEDMGIETITTTDLRVTSPGIGSRTDILKRVVDRLKTRSNEFAIIIQALSETKAVKRLMSSAGTDHDEADGFRKIMGFLIEVEKVKTPLDLASKLPMIELPPDEYQSVDQFESAIIKELDEFADQLRKRFVERDPIIDFLRRYYSDEEVIAEAAKWSSWISGLDIGKFDELLGRMPQSLYLSKHRAQPPEPEAKEKKSPKVRLLSVRPSDASIPSKCEYVTIHDEPFLRVYGADAEIEYELTHTTPSLKLGAKLLPVEPGYQKIDIRDGIKGSVELSNLGLGLSDAVIDGIYTLVFGPFDLNARKPGNELRLPVILDAGRRGWIAHAEGAEYDADIGCYKFDLHRLHIRITGENAPRQLDITFVKLSDDMTDALNATRWLSGLEVIQGSIQIESTEVQDREMGGSWTGYVVLRDPNDEYATFLIPVTIPKESSKYPVEIPEFHILTSLLGTPQERPRFRAGRVGNLDVEASKYISTILNEKGGLGLDDFLGRIDINDDIGRIQAQIRLREAPDLIEIEYNDILLKAERLFLNNPLHPFPLALSSNSELESGVPGTDWDEDSFKRLGAFEEFLNARKRLFDSLPKDRAFPLFDLTRFEPEVLEYVHAYGNLLVSNDVFSELDSKVRPAVGSLQFVDCVFVGDESCGYPVVLMSPLHPLKLLYHLAFQKKMNEIICDIVRQAGQVTVSFSSGDILRTGHLDYPDLLTYLPQNMKKVFRNVGSAHDYWSVFMDSGFPSFEAALPKLGGKRERLLRSLVVPRSFGAETDPAASIRERISQYLKAHFYMLQRDCPLRLLFVNVGEAGDVVDALKDLDSYWKQEGKYPDIRFEIMLVEVTDPNKIEVDTGRSLRRFLAGTGPDSKGYDELISRISYTIREFFSLKDLLQDSTIYSHIAFVRRIFDVDAVYVASNTTKYPDSVRADGLAVDSRTDYHAGEGKYTIGTNLKPPSHVEETASSTTLSISDIFWKFRFHQTRVLSENTERTQFLKLQLTVGKQIRKTLEWLHERCNWLCLLDRHFTQEYFEKDLQVDDKTILLNYTPKHEQERGSHVLLTTTGHTELVFKTMKQHFQTHVQLDLNADQSRRLISVMNQLSGTWVLSSLTLSYSALRGNLGMAAAALWLVNGETCKTAVRDGSPQIEEAKVLVPLGDYIRPYWLQKSIGARQQDVRYCDDLLELYLRPASDSVSLVGRIIEVKMRRDSISAEACKQVRSTYQLLTERFHLRANDPARVFVHRELAEMIDFYGRKMFRYGRWRDGSGKELPEGVCSDFLGKVVDAIAEGKYRISFDWRGTKGTVVGLTSHPDQLPECDDVEVDAFGPDKTKLILDGTLPSEYYDLDRQSDVSIPRHEESHVRRPIEQGARIGTPVSPQTTTDHSPPREEGVSKLPPASEPSFYLAASQPPEEWGVIARRKGAHVALNLHEPVTVCLFGVPGSGKSYTAGVILEAAQGIPSTLCKIAKRLTCLIFHYSEQERYGPEFVTIVRENQQAGEIDSLRKDYGAAPAKVEKLKVAVPALALRDRVAEYKHNPGVEVMPILFRPEELSSREWSLLMGVEGGQLYVKRIKQVISRLAANDELSLENLREAIEDDESLDSKLKELASVRLDFVSDYVSDSEQPVSGRINKGDVVVFDLRELNVDPKDAFVLFTILTRILTDPSEGNTLILIDEAHKYFKDQTSESIVELAREMRHRGAALVIASQDPPSIDPKIIENSSVIIAHKMTSGKWLKHLGNACSAFKNLTMEQFEDLRSGEAWLWASNGSPDYFRDEPRKVSIRPRATQHGGASKTN